MTAPPDDWELAEPRPEALIESLRAFGYSPEAAIADLVDNSISAGAGLIDVTFHWDGAASHVAVVDDGRGMTVDELRTAMRAGSISPRTPRSPRDLGRFGLGLKTASFSQARELSVITRSAGHQTCERRWDLDSVGQSGQWRLLTTASPASTGLLDDSNRSGTVVVWTKCDRMVGTVRTEDRKAHSRFLKLVEHTYQHLGLVFHRFLTGPGRIRITVNGRPVCPVDPFLPDHPATQGLGSEQLPLRGLTVDVQPFVLPHRSKLSDQQQHDGAGAGGWNNSQGFYVYRANRLLVAGSWLGLGFTKDEHTKLARIAVNFPTGLDDDWQIDVKKSSARPPGALADDLRRIAAATRLRAEEVYRHRGKAVARRSSQGFVHAWTVVKTRKGEIAYRLNRDHPVLAQALQGHPEQRRTVERVLRFIEETAPVTLIGIHLADAVQHQNAPYDGTERELEALLQFTVQQMIDDGLPPGDAIDMLAAAEPFAAYPHLIETVRERHEPSR